MEAVTSMEEVRGAAVAWPCSAMRKGLEVRQIKKGRKGLSERDARPCEDNLGEYEMLNVNLTVERERQIKRENKS
jgi:hypothetical protein